jgi:polyisoprenoid-binding protein YceI
MPRLVACVLAFAWIVLAPVAAPAETVYVFDRQHLTLAFSWQRLGLSRQQGRFTDVVGQLVFDPERAEDSTLEVAIRTASVQTGVDALDRHLRSPDFFDAAAHPLITFRSTAVKRLGPRTGSVTGDLTIAGVTQPVTLDVDWIFAGPHPLGDINPSLRGRPIAVFSAKTTVKRSAFGLTRGIPLVSDEIEIRIETELLGK